MKSLVETAAEHKTSRKFVNDYDFAVLDYIFNVEVHTAVRLYRLIYMVKKREVVRIHEVFYSEVFFGFLYAVREQRRGLCLFVDKIIAVVVVLFFLRVNFDDLDSL